MANDKPVYLVQRQRLCDFAMVEFGKFDAEDEALEYARAESLRGYASWTEYVYVYRSNYYGPVAVYYHGWDCYAD